MLSLVDEILCIWISIYATLDDPAKNILVYGLFYFLLLLCVLQHYARKDDYQFMHVR